MSRNPSLSIFDSIEKPSIYSSRKVPQNNTKSPFKARRTSMPVVGFVYPSAPSIHDPEIQSLIKKYPLKNIRAD